MKYLSEYRNKEVVHKLIEEIKSISQKREYNLMEVCGGQTHNLLKYGIVNMLPDTITMIHGPGCPVCVTPVSKIDKAIEIAKREDSILCSFGDMLRVPGSNGSLLEAKARGADIRIVYSPLDAVKIANDNPEKEVVFFAVGFETTAPVNAMSVKQASNLGLKNYSILVSQVLVPPAMESIIRDPDQQVHAFLAAGHVCTVMGTDSYSEISQKYRIPIVVMGFEPIDLLLAIKNAIQMLNEGKTELVNAYPRVVNKAGNSSARDLLDEVFDITEMEWRGIGKIPNSGLKLNEDYKDFDAETKFGTIRKTQEEEEKCIAGLVLKGIKKPNECPYFGQQCNPENPLGAPMVSNEGACAAYYHYKNLREIEV